MSMESPTQAPKLGGDVEDEDVDGQYLDDEYMDLDHAPASSHGTYVDGLQDDFESLEEYQEGGYHPIHLGDTLGASGRYRVIHKLGHGGFGTVWLCRDTKESIYVAVKIMAGHVTPDSLPDLTLAKLDRTALGAEYLAIPLDSFSVKGPNGVHKCIVLPVLGPCVSPGLWHKITKDPGLVLRGMAYQGFVTEVGSLDSLPSEVAWQAKALLDFRPSNILVKLSNLDELSEEELLSLLSQPQKAQVRTESGEDLPPSSPQYLVHTADMSRLGEEYLTDQICVIDFGETYPISSPPEDLAIPENYLPPEVLLDRENAIGPACDLWALGCTLFEIREQIPLFYMIYDLDELLAEMVRFFGKLPGEWWDEWEARADYFDEQGTWARDDEQLTLEVLLSKPSEVLEPTDQGVNGMRVKKQLITPEAEQKLIADLLYKLFCYDPKQRLSTEKVLAHEWFKT